jgi:hypothetical protein
MDLFWIALVLVFVLLTFAFIAVCDPPQERR